MTHDHSAARLAALLTMLALAGCDKFPGAKPAQESVPKSCAVYHFRTADAGEEREARQLLHALAMEETTAYFIDEDARWGVRARIRESMFSPELFLLSSYNGPHTDKRVMELIHLGRRWQSADGRAYDNCANESQRAWFERIRRAFAEKWPLRPGRAPLKRHQDG